MSRHEYEGIYINITLFYHHSLIIVNFVITILS